MGKPASTRSSWPPGWWRRPLGLLLRYHATVTLSTEPNPPPGPSARGRSPHGRNDHARLSDGCNAPRSCGPSRGSSPGRRPAACRRRVDLELAQHPVDQDLKVELAHAGDDRLAGLLVRADAEGRVLLAEGEQRAGQLVLVGLGLGLDRDIDHRLGELKRLEHDWVRNAPEGVAGRCRLEADHRDDVACVDRVAVLPVVRVHLEMRPMRSLRSRLS